MGMALLALILVSAFGVLQWALVGSLRQQSQTRSAFLAQQEMERLLQQDAPQGASGSLGPGYSWSSQVQENGDFLAVQVKVTGPAGAAFKLTTERRKSLHELVFRSQDKLLHTAEEMAQPGSLAEMPAGEYSLSPDGQQLAFAATHEGKMQIFVRGTHSQEAPQLLFEHPEGAGEPHYSPDGKQLAFSSRENGVSQVFVYTFSSKAWRNVSKNSHQENSPGWFPDSQSLLVCRDGNSIVRRLGNGGEEVLVPETQGWNAAPATDGKTVVFMSSRDGNPEIYALGLAAHKLARLTDDPAYDTAPQVQGQRVVFQSNRSGEQRLYSINLDGSELTPVAADRVGESPQWRP